jgi:signal transduction histidine kinase/PAS domain-containing protein
MTALNNLFINWKQRFTNWFDSLIERRWFDVGLRAKMGVMVTVGLAGLVSIFAFLGISSARQTTNQVLSERVMMARMSATSLDSTLNHIENTLSILAEQDVLSDPEASELDREATLQKLGIFRPGIFLLSLDGKVLASTTHGYHHNLILEWGQMISKGVFEGDNPSNLTVIPAQVAEEGTRWAVMTVPVRDHEDGLMGALATLIDLQDPEITPFEQPFTLGGTGTINVVDASGLALISSHPERELSSEDREKIIGELFVAGKPGVETCLGCYGSESPEARDEVIAFAPLSRAPWGVVVRQKAEEVFAPVRRLMFQILALGSIVIAGALGLVWVTTNSVILPVQSLTKMTERIARGELEKPSQCLFDEGPLSRGRRDEIGALTHSFTAMCAQLKYSMDEIQAWNRELDARVQERTREALAAQLEAQAVRDDLRAVIDALSDELVVISLDNYSIQQVNKAAQERRNGRGDLIGGFCYQLFHKDQPCRSPDCECPIPMVLARGQSVKVTHVHNCPGKDEECYMDIVASPMRDAGGRITRVVELIRDVTEERRIKESLLNRNQQLAILNSVATTVNQSLNIEEILSRALDEVLRLTEIDVGAVFLQEDMLSRLELMAYRGLSEEAAQLASDMGMLDGSCGGVIERGQVVIVPNISRYRGHRARSLQRESLCALMHVPLIAKGNVLGSMCVGTRQDNEFSQADQELLTAIGSQIAVAIENARLYAEVQHKEHVRGELFKKAINAQEDERRRIARELHDDTSQALAALLYAAEEVLEMGGHEEMKRKLAGMHELIQHTMDSVHKMIFNLRPSMLDHLGLVPALRQFASARLEPKGAQVTITEDSSERRLPPEVETALFRVVQEAISNCARHAAARHVSIGFQFESDRASVTVEDDGVGFDVKEMKLSQDSGRGLGLLGMIERVELLGGELAVDSKPEQGTRIAIHVPVDYRSMAYV